MALAETPANDEPIGPDDLANPTENPEPEPCDEPGDCLANPTEDPGPGGEGGNPEPPADVDEPVLANPTFTG
jgi:hypothetical protein